MSLIFKVFALRLSRENIYSNI